MEQYGAYKGAQYNFKNVHIPYNIMWEGFYDGVKLANLVIDEISSFKKSKILDKTMAELKVSRAIYFYRAMDNFGNIPLDTLLKSPKGSVKTNTRIEAFKFIEKELKQNIPLLRRASNN